MTEINKKFTNYHLKKITYICLKIIINSNTGKDPSADILDKFIKDSLLSNQEHLSPNIVIILKSIPFKKYMKRMCKNLFNQIMLELSCYLLEFHKCY